nr:hypothetical protein [Tanacetum cinerariifolium]
MRTRPSANLPGESSPNPTSLNLKRQAIVVPSILAEQFDLKHSLINMMTSDQFFRLEKDNPHDHIRWFNKITSTIKYKDAWDRYKDLLRACPHHGFTKLHQLDTFYNTLNPADQDSLNSVVGGNLLERRTQDVLTIIKNKSKVCNSQNKSIVSQVKSSDANSSSFEIAKLTHAVNQQTSAMTTAMTAILKQFQATPPPASVKAVEEIYVTCAVLIRIISVLLPMATLSQNFGIVFKDTFQQLQLITIRNLMACFFQMNTASTSGSGPLPSNTIANPKSELKAITTRSGIVLDGPSVPMPPPFINLEKDERVKETLTDPDLAEYTIKVPPPLFQKSKPPSQRNYVVHQRDPLHLNIPYPLRMHKQKQQEKDEKMLKALISNKEKLLELENIPLNENWSAVILKKLPEKLRDPRKFLISCGFSELNYKALADLGASINLMPLSIWKKLGLPELISICMTLELANWEICTPAGIARDVFVFLGLEHPTSGGNTSSSSVSESALRTSIDELDGFVIVDYESDPRVPLILGRPFLRTARALIDVHGEEMILCDGNERLTLNMRHDTSIYSNQPQKEPINMINIYDDSCEDFLEDLFARNHLSSNPTFSSHTDLTLPEVKDDIFDLDGDIVLIEKLINLDSTKDVPPPHNINPLSGSTTSSSLDHLLEEFADELALITFSPGNDDLPFDIEFDLKEIEYLLNHDPTKDMDSILEDSIDEDNLAEPNDNLVDTILEMFIDEHALDYSSPLLYDDFDDDLDEFKSDNDDAYNDPFDSKAEKIKEPKLLIDEFNLPRSSDFLLSLEYDSFLFEDFFEVDALPSTNNEDKVFNPTILIHENLVEITTRVAPDKNVKKIAISHASLILEDFDPPLYELPFQKEVLESKTLLSFSSKNEKKVFKPEILTSKGVYSSLLSELSHRGHKVFKLIKIFESPMEIFPCFFGEHRRIFDVPCLHFYPP